MRIILIVAPSIMIAHKGFNTLKHEIFLNNIVTNNATRGQVKTVVLRVGAYVYRCNIFKFVVPTAGKAPIVVIDFNNFYIQANNICSQFIKTSRYCTT
jgi:hypothetical protein